MPEGELDIETLQRLMQEENEWQHDQWQQEVLAQWGDGYERASTKAARTGALEYVGIVRVANQEKD